MKINSRRLRSFCSILALSAALGTAGCWRDATNGMRMETAKRLAMPSFMIHREIPADPFMLTAFERVRQPGAPVTVYIEGDGLAWVSRQTPSRDPTPVNPVALHLATRDLGPNVIWLARPCQHSGLTVEGPCPVEYWTSRRFSPLVIQTMGKALDDIKARYRVTGFDLVGYSGGGAVAALLAAGREDVLSLRTVAGNLDTDLFSDTHQVSRLTGSENPAARAGETAGIPQHHFVGEWDTIVPAALSASYTRAMGPSPCLRTSMIKEADHEEGWVNGWPEMLKAPLDCRGGG